MTRGRESNEIFAVVHGQQTAADVVAESLSRTWIDRPAIAVRAELRAGRPFDEVGVRQTREANLLDGAEVRRLIERASTLERRLGKNRYELEHQRRIVCDLIRDRELAERSVAGHEARLAEAKRVLEQHDHLFSRRRRRVEVESARAQFGWVPRTIEQEREKLDRTVEALAQAQRRLAEAVAESVHRPELAGELAGIRRELDADARERALLAADRRCPTDVPELGVKPAGGAAGELWLDAAGRLLQHHAAFGEPGGSLLGREPDVLDVDAYASSHRAVVAAIERMDRATRPELEIELPHQSLGLSL